MNSYYADGPTLEERSLWDDLADAGDQIRELKLELAAARAEADQLRAQLAASHRPARRPVRVG